MRSLQEINRAKFEKTYAHVNVPWQARHDDVKLARDKVTKTSHITINPQRGQLHTLSLQHIAPLQTVNNANSPTHPPTAPTSTHATPSLHTYAQSLSLLALPSHIQPGGFGVKDESSVTLPSRLGAR